MFNPWRRYDKSWVENLLSIWTSLLLAVLAVTSLMLRYVKEPISCHYIYPEPNKYFTEFCFDETSIIIRTDEFLEFSTQFWNTHNPRGRGSPNPYELWPKQRTWHQWVPLALGLAALLCLLPLVIWRMLTAFLWMDNHALVQTIADSQSRSSGHHVTVKDSALVVFVKGFIFLFYFFLFLLVLCVWDVFYWLGRLFLPHLRDVTLRRNLSVLNQSEDGRFGHDPVQFSHFLQFLGPDGRLMVALVADHCGPVAGVHFTSQLWQAFHGSSFLQEHGSTPRASHPASVGSSAVLKEEGYAAGNSTARDMDMGEAPQTDKDTAKLFPE